MPEHKIDINALGQCIDTTWGRSSTPKVASHSVKVSFVGFGRLLVSYASLVYFVSERQMIDVKRAYVSEADSIVVETIKKIKSLYKEMTGSTLSLKIVPETQSDSIEVINVNVHNIRRTAYYRRKVQFEIG